MAVVHQYEKTAPLFMRVLGLTAAIHQVVRQQFQASPALLH
jgi:hypothetical protein